MMRPTCWSSCVRDLIPRDELKAFQEESFDANAPKNPFNFMKYKVDKDIPFSDMPWIVTRQVF